MWLEMVLSWRLFTWHGCLEEFPRLTWDLEAFGTSLVIESLHIFYKYAMNFRHVDRVKWYLSRTNGIKRSLEIQTTRTFSIFVLIVDFLTVYAVGVLWFIIYWNAMPFIFFWNWVRVVITMLFSDYQRLETFLFSMVGTVKCNFYKPLRVWELSGLFTKIRELLLAFEITSIFTKDYALWFKGLGRED